MSQKIIYKPMKKINNKVSLYYKKEKIDKNKNNN